MIPPVAALPSSNDRLFTVSIVSHAHDAWLRRLLQDLLHTAGHLIDRVVITHNLPASAVAHSEPDWPFDLQERFNTEPVGFATNHNRAFALARSPLFCILNPDIALPDPQIWMALANQARNPHAGCIYPKLINPDGTRQDNRRAVPTPWALFRRRVLHRDEQRLDWISAAFWVVPAQLYANLGGLDERYRLYCEDVDFCLRLQLAGWHLVPAQTHAVHDAQRSSHRRWLHLSWHLTSLLRLWTSPALWRYLHRRPQQRATHSEWTDP